jgi:hypothetical protein
MVRNIDGLKRSARSRSEGAMQRATAAILQMQSDEADINFRSVAAHAKVSTAWLYGTKSVRDKIVKSRGNSPTPHSNIGGSQSRPERTTRSRLRRTCGGTAEVGFFAPNVKMMR